MRNATKIGLLLLVVLAAILAFVALKPDDKDTRTPNRDKTLTTQKSPTFVKSSLAVEAGKPVGGVKTVDARKGERVYITVQSKDGSGSPAEVHIHGYNLIKELKPGGAVHFKFVATLEGEFDVELHAESEAEIAKLQVQP